MAFFFFVNWCHPFGRHFFFFNLKLKKKNLAVLGQLTDSSLHGLLFICNAWAYLPRGMWDLSPLMKDLIHVPCIGRWILNHQTASEVPNMWLSKSVLNYFKRVEIHTCRIYIELFYSQWIIVLKSRYYS